MTLGELLKINRDVRGLSIRNAAIGIGISSGHLNDLEKGGIIHPKMICLHKIANFYEIPEDDLCIIAERIPSDVFWKIIHCPELLGVIRKYKGA